MSGNFGIAEFYLRGDLRLNSTFDSEACGSLCADGGLPREDMNDDWAPMLLMARLRITRTERYVGEGPGMDIGIDLRCALVCHKNGSQVCLFYEASKTLPRSGRPISLEDQGYLVNE